LTVVSELIKGTSLEFRVIVDVTETYEQTLIVSDNLASLLKSSHPDFCS